MLPRKAPTNEPK